jgi:chromosome partitioning protein
MKNKNTKIISIVAEKGGVGKSTTTIALSSIMANMNKKILVIDTDGQRNATLGLGLKESELNFYNAFIDTKDLSKYITNSDYKNLDIIMGDTSMVKAEKIAAHINSLEAKVKRMFTQVIKSSIYDYVLIDTNPTRSAFNQAILATSDYALVIVEPESFSITSLNTYINDCKEINDLHGKPEILGILINNYKQKRILTKESEKILNEMYSDILFKTKIKEDSEISKSQWLNIPIDRYNKNARSVVDFKNLAKEIIKRCQNSIN